MTKSETLQKLISMSPAELDKYIYEILDDDEKRAELIEAVREVIS